MMKVARLWQECNEVHRGLTNKMVAKVVEAEMKAKETSDEDEQSSARSQNTAGQPIRG